MERNYCDKALSPGDSHFQSYLQQSHWMEQTLSCSALTRSWANPSARLENGKFRIGLCPALFSLSHKVADSVFPPNHVVISIAFFAMCCGRTRVKDKRTELGRGIIKSISIAFPFQWGEQNCWRLLDKKMEAPGKPQHFLQSTLLLYIQLLEGLWICHRVVNSNLPPTA